MPMAASRLFVLAGDGYGEESAQLILAAERRLREIYQHSTWEGERLMAAEVMKAMKRIDVMIQAHRMRLARVGVAGPTARPVLEKRRWWLALHRT